MGDNSELLRLRCVEIAAEGNDSAGKKAEQSADATADNSHAESDTSSDLDPLLPQTPPPGCELVCFRHHSNHRHEDVLELIKRDKYAMPAWSGAVVHLTEGLLLLGSGDLPHLRMLRGHENVREKHAQLIYNRQRGWTLESFGG